MSKITKIGAALALIAIGGIMINAVQDPPTDVNLKAKIINDYNIYALPLPERLTFADEVISLKDPNIKERFDRELLVNTYWQSNGLLLFKRANKYFPIIEPILKRYGIPDDFKYIAVIESGLQNVVSPVGARGFWQIMPATGKEKGLEVNKNVDERYHLEMATEVACKYFLEAKERFGTWMLAAASYNTGQSGIDRRLEEQKVDSYFDLLLGEEAGRYLFRVLALKEIMTQPKKYGFNFREKDLYTLIPTYKVRVDTAVNDFTSFAIKYGINYKILKLHNPWLREPHLNNKSRKVYQIEIPEEGFYTNGK